MTSKEYRRFLAVDGGGTKTVLLVADEEGTILYVCYGESTNLKSRAWDDVKAELSRLLHEGLKQSNTSMEQVDGIVLGMAGSDRPEDIARIIGHLSSHLPEQAPIAVYNDAVTALAAGTFGERGLVLISGTGSICCGFEPETNAYVRVGGWGYVFGDEGSGFDLGKKALQAVMKAYDGRGEATLLTKKVLEKLSLVSPDKLVTAIYEADNMRAKVAALSPVVFAAAAQGDNTAKLIIAEAVHDLAALVAAAYSRLKAIDESTMLITSGGVFQEPSFLRAFKERLDTYSLSLNICTLNVPPVIGSYYLALKQAGRIVTPEIINRIQQQCNDKGEFKDEVTRKL